MTASLPVRRRRAFRPARALLAAALAVAALPAAAQTYSQTVFFGDSLTDSGAFRPGLVQVGGPSAGILGRFTTNPGWVWAEYLADYYGTNAAAANQGGTNYAVGGARNGADGSSPFGPIPSVLNQVGGYLAANGGRADANALYTVWGGANDLFAITDPATAPASIGAAVTAQVTAIGALEHAGARYILVPTIPDLGLTPSYRAQGPLVSGFGTQLASSYNDALFDALTGNGLRVIPLDTFHLIQEIAADPGRYGFRNVTGTACVPPGSSSLTCNPNTWASPDAPTAYLFADGVHPTGGAHAILADFALATLEGPRQLAILPMSEAMVGRARAERVMAQLDGRSGDGMRWWMDVRGDNQRYGETNHYDGGGPTLSVGIDWGSDALRYGGFAGYGVQEIDFGLRRGEFEQTDATLGGYLAWRGDALWVNGQVSWTRLGFEVDREVHLGPAVRVHSGSPDGENLSAGVGAGWDFSRGRLTHGPVLSLLSQRIEVDGYAENSTESTALAYPEQEFDSLLGSLGWRAEYAINDHVRPYARLTIDREFEDFPEEAFARSLSVAGSDWYAVPGLERDDQYGTLQFGVRTQLFGLDADIGASATVNQGGGNDATVFASFGGRF
jgi:outer membrane lipase/esterase